MATIQRSHLNAALARRSQQDADVIFNALQVDGNINVVDDPEVEIEVDDEGNELAAPQAGLVERIEVELDNAEDAEDIVLTPRESRGEGYISEEAAMATAEARAANAPKEPKKSGNGRKKKAEEPAAS